MPPKNKAIQEYWKGLGEKLGAYKDALYKSHPDWKRFKYNPDDGVNECFTFAALHAQTITFLSFQLHWDDVTRDSAQVRVTGRGLQEGELSPDEVYRIINSEGEAFPTASDGVTRASYEDVKAILRKFLENYK